MAQKVQVIRISDLSGDELGEAGQTVEFSIGSTGYSIDLSDKEAEKFFDAFKKYTDVATKTSGRGVKSSSRKSGGSGRTDLADVRAWAKEQGMEVSERGRVSQDILSAYDAAH